MGVVEPKVQTVGDMYRLIWTAIATKEPIGAIYMERYVCLALPSWACNRMG